MGTKLLCQGGKYVGMLECRGRTWRRAHEADWWTYELALALSGEAATVYTRESTNAVVLRHSCVQGRQCAQQRSPQIVELVARTTTFNLIARQTGRVVFDLIELEFRKPLQPICVG